MTFSCLWSILTPGEYATHLPLLLGALPIVQGNTKQSSFLYKNRLLAEIILFAFIHYQLYRGLIMILF